MAQVKLKIEVNPNAETEKIGDITNKVNDVGSKSNLSNVSIKAKDNGMFIVKEMNNNGRELLSFGESGSIKFTQDGYLTSDGITKGELASEQNPDMFVWGVVPSNKQYSVKLTFINAQNLKDIVVYGDKVSNQFPIEAIIDNKKVIYSNDYRWAINLGVESDTHTIEFTKWNRGDYNACLTLIRVMLRYFEISNSSGLIELESLSQSNSQPKEIYYGLIPNTGSASVNDNYGEINDLINEEIITNSMNNIEIYIDDKKIQHHITTDSDYEDGKVFTMELENSLSFLETKYGGRKLTDSMSAYALLSEVLKTLNYTNEQIDFMLNEDIIYGDGETGSVKSYLEKITIEYPYLESSSYRETLNKFCTLAQLNLMEDDNGNLKFVSARPIDVESKPVIVIPTNRQFSRLVKDEFLKNKYNNPFVQYVKFEGEPSLFGESKNASYIEDNGNVGKAILPTNWTNEQIEVDISKYLSTYNNEAKNPLYHKTSIVTKDNNSYYKTTLILPIPKEIILKNINDLKLGINGNKIGTNQITYETGPDIDIPTHVTSTYRPYKTSNFDAIIEIKEGQNKSFKNIYIENVERNNNYIKLDILFAKENEYIDVVEDYLDFSNPYITSASFQLYGTTYRYELVENKNNIDIEIRGNELIQEGTLYNNSKPIYDLNRNNIIVDYTKGIRTANISVACLDYYDTKGNKVIDWSKNQIIQVGQIVRIDKDNLGNSKVNYIDGEPYLWKVTSRKFRYNGIGMLDLELQEVKFNSYYLINETIGNYASVKYTRISSEYGASIGEITNKDVLYPNDVIKIDISLQENDIYEMGNIYVNGEIFTSGNTITIEKPLVVVVNTNVKTFTINSTIGEGATLIINRKNSPNGKGSLGIVDVNAIFYYGDLVDISWTLDSGYGTDTAYLNGEQIYSFESNQITITSDINIVINTKTIGYEEIWSGDYNYQFNDLTSNESIIELPININTKYGLRLTFDRITLFNVSDNESADEITNITREIPFTISSEFGSWWSSQPSITFEYKQLAVETTNQLKTIRILGSYNGNQYIVGSFKLTKIEQYIG